MLSTGISWETYWGLTGPEVESLIKTHNAIHKKRRS